MKRRLIIFTIGICMIIALLATTIYLLEDWEASVFSSYVEHFYCAYYYKKYKELPKDLHRLSEFMDNRSAKFYDSTYHAINYNLSPEITNYRIIKNGKALDCQVQFRGVFHLRKEIRFWKVDPPTD